MSTRAFIFCLIALFATSTITEVYPIDITEIKAGSYVGSAATTLADGSLQAIGILVGRGCSGYRYGGIA